MYVDKAGFRLACLYVQKAWNADICHHSCRYSSVLRQDFILAHADLGLTLWPGLAKLMAVLPTKCLDYSSAPPCSAFSMGAEDRTQVLVLVWQAPYSTEPSPQSLC